MVPKYIFPDSLVHAKRVKSKIRRWDYHCIQHEIKISSMLLSTKSSFSLYDLLKINYIKDLNLQVY